MKWPHLWNDPDDDGAARAERERRERMRRADEWLRAEKLRRRQQQRSGDGLPPLSERLLSPAELRRAEEDRATADPAAVAERELRAALARVDAERDPAVGARMALSILSDFAATADAETLEVCRPLCTGRILHACEILGGTALPLLGGLTAVCDNRSVLLAMRQWMRHPDERNFVAAWDVAIGYMQTSPAIRAWWLQAMRAKDGDIAPEFRTLADRRVLTLVQRQFDALRTSEPDSLVWQLMFAVGPVTRGGWYLRLGDHARRGGDHRAAIARYLAAHAAGEQRAASRLARCGDLAAYRALGDGGAPTVDTVLTPYPSPYQRLLRAVWNLEHGAPVPTEFTQAEGYAGIRVVQLFVAGLVAVRRGASSAARTHLSDVIQATSEAGENDLAVNARLIFGVLTGDDSLITRTARGMFDRLGERWHTRSMVGGPAVVAAVLRCDPKLAAILAGDGDMSAVLVAAARTSLVRAARSALSGEADQARAAHRQALELLDDLGDAITGSVRADADRIGLLIDRLAARSGEELYTRTGFAALRRNGAILPWTADAARTWRDREDELGFDPATGHHLAIAEHARAFELELAGDESATTQWDLALRAWARLHASDPFWEVVRTRLAGALLDATSGEIAAAVEEARAALPGRLLDLHVTRVKSLLADRPGRARAHIGIIRTAPFARGEIERAERELLREVSFRTRRLVRDGRIGAALDELLPWCDVDPGNIGLAELVLDAGIPAHGAHPGSSAEWADRDAVLKRAATMLVPVRAVRNLSTTAISVGGIPRAGDRELVHRIGRFEFWLGTCRLMHAVTNAGIAEHTRRTMCRESLTHLAVARRLGLPAQAPYDQIGELLALAEAQGGERPRW